MKIAENENQMAQPSFWEEQDLAQKIIQSNNEMKQVYDTFQSLIVENEELELIYEMLKEESDEEIKAELEARLAAFQIELGRYGRNLLLSGPHDRQDAILEIHPGAGGVESQDWASMLLRMYQRWADRHDFKVTTLDYTGGDEAGIKNVSLEISGLNAYGLLKSEHGVHRLVRISPFDSNSRRHTSFASIEVMPVIDQETTIDINEDDIKIDVFRASGAGGQHINKTSSAVRMTHIPTGIVVASQSQRSQFQNKELAMKMLQSKLAQLLEEKNAKELDDIRGEKSEIAWGSQIRSYVFHPYNMVKDHRTDYEVGNIQGVMDGDIDGFIDAYLKNRIED